MDDPLAGLGVAQDATPMAARSPTRRPPGSINDEDDDDDDQVNDDGKHDQDDDSQAPPPPPPADDDEIERVKARVRRLAEGAAIDRPAHTLATYRDAVNLAVQAAAQLGSGGFLVTDHLLRLLPPQPTIVNIHDENAIGGQLDEESRPWFFDNERYLTYGFIEASLETYNDERCVVKWLKSSRDVIERINTELGFIDRGVTAAGVDFDDMHGHKYTIEPSPVLLAAILDLFTMMRIETRSDRVRMWRDVLRANATFAIGYDDHAIGPTIQPGNAIRSQLFREMYARWDFDAAVQWLQGRPNYEFLIPTRRQARATLIGGGGVDEVGYLIELLHGLVGRDPQMDVKLATSTRAIEGLKEGTVDTIEVIAAIASEVNTTDLVLRRLIRAVDDYARGAFRRDLGPRLTQVAAPEDEKLEEALERRADNLRRMEMRDRVVGHACMVNDDLSLTRAKRSREFRATMNAAGITMSSFRNFRDRIKAVYELELVTKHADEEQIVEGWRQTKFTKDQVAAAINCAAKRRIGVRMAELPEDYLDMSAPPRVEETALIVSVLEGDGMGEFGRLLTAGGDGDENALRYALRRYSVG